MAPGPGFAGIETEVGTAAAGRPLGTISTLVSLFLLLLVFFVLLFSIAQIHRQRAAEVLKSVDVAFGGLPSKLGLMPRPAPEDSTVTGSAEAFARSVAVLLTGFTPEQADIGDGATLLRIELPVERLFKPGSVELTSGARDVIRPLAVLLSRRPNAQQHYRLSFRAISADGADPQAAARAANFAASLYAAGCPAEALAAGTEAGKKPLLRLDFAVIGSPPDTE